MSIDYDRLREQLHIATERDTSRAPCRVGNEDEDGFLDVRDADFNVVAWRMTRRDAELVAMLPDLARELLRLRRELTDLRDLMWTHAKYQRTDGYDTAADWTENHAYRLTRIIQGDTK